ncbi:MAG: SDR family NAD(P)-dependent oxidoreductase [bacterium]
MDGKLEGRVALVTGSARGIGRAIAETFLREGARVALADIDYDAVSKAARQIPRPEGDRALPLRADVSQKAQVDEMVRSVRERFGRIDILVNNAGILENIPILEITEDRWDRMMAVNLKSVLLVSQAVIPIMKESGGGKIVNIASIAGKIGGILAGAHYAVSKAGVICLTKCLAKEMAKFKINVNCICPAITDTEMAKSFGPEGISKLIEGIPLGRMAKPEEVARAALFLVSDDSDFITGEVLDVNGGSLMD